MMVLILRTESVPCMVYKPSSLCLPFYTETPIMGLELFGPSLPTDYL